MSLTVKNAEDELIQCLSLIKTDYDHWYAVFFNFSKLESVSVENGRLDLIIDTVNKALIAKESQGFLLYDNDFVVFLKSPDQNSISKALNDLTYLLANDPLLHQKSGINGICKQYYLHNDLDEFSRICLQKVRMIDRLKELEQVVDSDLKIQEDYLKTFNENLRERETRDFLSILIVEDNIFSRQLLRGVLRNRFYVYEAQNSQEGLGMFVKHTPDIVFVDLGLPDHNGHDLIEKIAEIDDEVFIVVVSANNCEEEIERALLGGAKGFVLKPFCKAQLDEYIDLFFKENPNKSKIFN